MLNETINGIARQLKHLFSDDYAIYINEIKQGLQLPCFLIVCTTGNQEQEIGPAYTRGQAFDIHYFPQSCNITQEVNSVVETLSLGLEYITVDNSLVRGAKLRHEVIDGVLHFFVNYDIRVRKVIEPDPFMEELEIIEEVKQSGE